MDNSWTRTDRILYGIMAGGVVIWAVAMFIEACRTRPKVLVFTIGQKKLDDKQKDVKQPAKQGPSESESQ